MASPYPLEGLLRAPYELTSAAAAAAAAALVTVAPGAFALPPWGALATAGTLAALACWRMRQAWRLARYRAGLWATAPLRLRAGALPAASRGIYLGRGFRWSTRHTQRWYEFLRDPVASRPPRQDVSWWHQFRADASSLGAVPAALQVLARRAVGGSVDDQAQAGGTAALHGVEPREADIFLNSSERVGHMLVLGTTRSGKTRLLEILAAQDIRRGDVVIVVDPKGDVGILRRLWLEACRCGREQEFYFLHLGYPELSARYNPLGSFTRVSEVADRVAQGVAGSGESDVFRQFIWHFVHVTTQALVTLGERPTYRSIRHYLMQDLDALLLRYLDHVLARDQPGQDWRAHPPPPGAEVSGVPGELRARSELAWRALRLYRHRNLRDETAEALIELVAHPRQHFEKLSASGKPLLGKLTAGKVGELISPNYAHCADTRPVIDWNSIIGGSGIVYVGLDALASQAVARAVGTAMFADLTSVAARVYKRGIDDGQSTHAPQRTLSIHADEFSDLIGEEFIPMVNKAGGAGFQVVAYTQTAADIEARVGSPARARQVAGNFNSRICLRVVDEQTARAFTDRLGDSYIASSTVISRAVDARPPMTGQDFYTHSEDRLANERVAVLRPSDLGQLPRGHAFALVNGGQLYKLRIPLIDDEGEPGQELTIEDIARLCAQTAPHRPNASGTSHADV